MIKGNKILFYSATLEGLNAKCEYDPKTDRYYHCFCIYSEIGVRKLSIFVPEKELSDEKAMIRIIKKLASGTIKKYQLFDTLEKSERMVIEEFIEKYGLNNLEMVYEEIIDKMRWYDNDNSLVQKISKICYKPFEKNETGLKFDRDAEDVDIMVYDGEIIAIGNCSVNCWFELYSQQLKAEYEIREKYIPKKKSFFRRIVA